MRPLSRLLPANADGLTASPWLRWARRAVADRRLWRMQRRPVATGAALGAFFAFATPVAQIPAAVAMALVLRANVPWAVAATFLNTPLTFGPVYFAAYYVGAGLLNEPLPAAAGGAENGSALSWTAAGQALLAGAVLFGAVAAALVYGGVHLYWDAKVRARARRWRRLRAGAHAPS